jgi:hypothetical protein
VAIENKGKFKKGKSGNPLGRPKLPDDLRAQLRTHKSKFKLLVLEYASLTKAQLKEIADNINSGWLQSTLAKHFLSLNGDSAYAASSSPVPILETALGSLPDRDLDDGLTDDELRVIELWRQRNAEIAATAQKRQQLPES